MKYEVLPSTSCSFYLLYIFFQVRGTYVKLKKDYWDRYRQEVEAALSKRYLPTDCHRDDLRKRDPTSLELPRLNYDNQNRIYAHTRQTLRDFVETLDQKTDVTKLWRTIKGIDGSAKREAENEAITLKGGLFSLSKQLASRFNQQFNTSKLGRHTLESSRTQTDRLHHRPL